MIVTLSAEAEDDLEQIADFIANDNPARALSFVRELRETCLALADMPGRFPLAPGYEAYGVRRYVHGSYLVFYRIEPEQEIVLHILHGARDYGAILSPF